MKLKTLIITLSLAFVCTTALTQSLPKAIASKPAGEAGIDYNLYDNAGEKHGVWIRVYADGSLYYVGAFNSGQPEGQFLYFFETGELMSKIEHPSASNLAAKISAIHYRTNSSVQSSGFYISVDDQEIPVKDGSWGFYDEGSKQIKQESYSAGILNGSYWIKTKKGSLVESTV